MLGNAGTRLARLVDLAEELYERVAELREAVGELRQTTEATGERVERLEAEVAAQGAVLDALAEREGVDVDAVRGAASTGPAGGDAADDAAGEGADGPDADDGEGDPDRSTDAPAAAPDGR